MKSPRRPERFSLSRRMLLGLALTVALAGCQGDGKEAKGPETVPAGQEAKLPEGKAPEGKAPLGTSAKEPETKTIDSPEAHAQLVNEMAESRKQAQSKQTPVDPEVEKRMKDPEYRKQKDAMLNRLSQVSTNYFKQGIEIRHTRKRPEWRLIDPKLAEVTDAAARKQQGEALAKRFKGEVEPILEKPIAVKVFADASESIEVY